MPAGMQAFDANGNLVADLTDRLAKLIASGSLTFTAAPQRFTISVPGMVNDGTWYVSCTGQVVTRIFSGYFEVVRFDYFTSVETHYWAALKQ